ncbi:unnamed protein product [Didymodactylos carnosus]|uniref:Uncharacterized protein n=1 Tax=Didymodactylos carnosus TaxID=1234261 RepID=A0A813NLF9_9BILA|nr:unnamed protein product [Didymodactylos carnosus]CAF0736992.1 unnamed protein product [Didymodactylos carnosus]CAF3494837.1 unnamed protein product [Didymodactylos carnosus]CAF3514973.1 unnamed protein product [Didymodactylos carnosus]
MTTTNTVTDFDGHRWTDAPTQIADKPVKIPLINSVDIDKSKKRTLTTTLERMKMVEDRQSFITESHLPFSHEYRNYSTKSALNLSRKDEQCVLRSVERSKSAIALQYYFCDKDKVRLASVNDKNTAINQSTTSVVSTIQTSILCDDNKQQSLTIGELIAQEGGEVICNQEETYFRNNQSYSKYSYNRSDLRKPWQKDYGNRKSTYHYYNHSNRNHHQPFSANDKYVRDNRKIHTKRETMTENNDVDIEKKLNTINNTSIQVQQGHRPPKRIPFPTSSIHLQQQQENSSSLIQSKHNDNKSSVTPTALISEPKDEQQLMTHQQDSYAFRDYSSKLLINPYYQTTYDVAQLAYSTLASLQQCMVQMASAAATTNFPLMISSTSDYFYPSSPLMDYASLYYHTENTATPIISKSKHQKRQNHHREHERSSTHNYKHFHSNHQHKCEQRKETLTNSRYNDLQYKKAKRTKYNSDDYHYKGSSSNDYSFHKDFFVKSKGRFTSNNRNYHS